MGACRFLLLCLLILCNHVVAAPTHLVQESPLSIKEIRPGVYLVDFGTVAFGNLVLASPSDVRARVTIHFGEALKNGRIDRDPPGTVRYRETRATLTGGEPKRIAPGKDKRNTSSGNANTPPAVRTPEEWDVVIPFRWVEIEGLPGLLRSAHVSRNAAYLRA